MSLGFNHWKDGNYLEIQIWHHSQVRVLYLRDLDPTQQKMTQVINHHFNLTKVPFTNLNWAKITFPRILESKTLTLDFAYFEFRPINEIWYFFLCNFRKILTLILQFSENCVGKNTKIPIFGLVFDSEKYGYEIFRYQPRFWRRVERLTLMPFHLCSQLPSD